MRVRWDDIEKTGVFEDMIAVLISLLHPSAQRIDGKGGDGGRDVQVPLPDGLHAYELKSFTGRIIEKPYGRRTQVAKSLARAAKLKPVKWHLVVPIDPTPDELAWFDRLRAKYPFPLEWCGKTWLDREMSARPGLQRYFLSDGYKEVVHLLKELHEEEASIGSVPDALARMRAIVDRLAEADIFYRYEITFSPDGGVSVTPYPAYPGAEHDRPIEIRVEGRFPDTPEGRSKLQELQSAMDFGTTAVLGPDHVTTVQIEGPDLGLPTAGGTVTVSAVPDGWTMGATLRIVSPEGRVLAALPVKLGDRTSGMKGGVMHAVDYSGALTARFLFNVAEHNGTVTVGYHEPNGALPASVLPALQLLEVLTSPNTLALDLEGNTPDNTFPLDGVTQPLIPAGYVRLMEKLVRVQMVTHTSFPAPDVFSEDDQVAIYRADSLLKGEKVRVKWNGMKTQVGVINPEALREAITRGPGTMAVSSSQYEEVICGIRVPIGRVRLLLPACDIANRDELLAMPIAEGDQVELRLVPAGSDEAEWELEGPVA